MSISFLNRTPDVIRTIANAATFEPTGDPLRHGSPTPAIPDNQILEVRPSVSSGRGGPDRAMSGVAFHVDGLDASGDPVGVAALRFRARPYFSAGVNGPEAPFWIALEARDDLPGSTLLSQELPAWARKCWIGLEALSARPAAAVGLRVSIYSY